MDHDTTPFQDHLFRARMLAIHLRAAGASADEVEQTLWRAGIHPAIAAAVTATEQLEVALLAATS